ncbi:MAG: MFS transporter [Defluviitaleaceae bacterium]|nr:MFS transporter [Defluviitaleaceae bacterium]
MKPNMKPNMKLKNYAVLELLPFFIYYGTFFMGAAVVGTFMNVYFKEEIGLSLAQIGIISTIGPLVSIIAQPLWGILSDRTNKRSVLMLLIFGALVAALLFPLHNAFAYIAVIATVYALFNNSIVPLGDAIALQFTENRKIKYNTVRAMGTISYATMAMFIGSLVSGNFTRIFYILAICMGTTLFAAFFMPNFQKSEKVKVAVPPLKESLLELFKNKMVLCILASSLVFGLAMTFYHSFIGIQMRSLGATDVMVGRAMALSAASEVPVLLLINKIFGKKKPSTILMIVGSLMAIRLTLLFTAGQLDSLAIVYASQLLHGFTFMVHFYFTVTLLNTHAPTHMKSTVQCIHAVMRAFAALLGSGLGGGVAEQVGISNVFLMLAVFVFVTCVVVPGVARVGFGVEE